MTESKAKKERVYHSAQEKAQAVLAVWTERRRSSEICRELEVKLTVLTSWQERAMEGMLAALKPRLRLPEEQVPMLPGKVEKLLTRKCAEAPQSKLGRRLTKLAQAPKPSEKEEAKA